MNLLTLQSSCLVAVDLVVSVSFPRVCIQSRARDLRHSQGLTNSVIKRYNPYLINHQVVAKAKLLITLLPLILAYPVVELTTATQLINSRTASNLYKAEMGAVDNSTSL